jgi:hypothetical protein
MPSKSASTDKELLSAASRLKAMAKALADKEQSLLVWQKKLEDREATLRATMLEIKLLNGRSKVSA